MIQLDEDTVRQWSLTFSDSITNQFKSNLNLTNFSVDEILFNQFLESEDPIRWVLLCQDYEINQKIFMSIPYLCITSLTNSLFSSSSNLENSDRQLLTFSETFFAEKVSSIMVDAFFKNGHTHNFVRNEFNLNLIHPFLEDDSIMNYQFSWCIDEKEIGTINVCHSHVF